MAEGRHHRDRCVERSLPPMEHIIDWGWNEVAAVGTLLRFRAGIPCAERSGPSTPRTARTDRRYDGYIHFGFMLTLAEAIDGVWALARACIRNYLILRDKVEAFDSDHRCRPLSRRLMVSELDTPTLSAGEALVDIRGETADVEALGARSVGLEALDQLAMEHSLGVR